MEKDNLQYLVDVTLPEDFDLNAGFEMEALYPFLIENMQFSTPSYLPLDNN